MQENLYAQVFHDTNVDIEVSPVVSNMNSPNIPMNQSNLRYWQRSNEVSKLTIYFIIKHIALFFSFYIFFSLLKLLRNLQIRISTISEGNFKNRLTNVTTAAGLRMILKRLQAPSHLFLMHQFYHLLIHRLMSQ